MNTLMVGYDLVKPGQTYTQLIDKLNSFPSHWHCLDSTWFVKANLTPVELHNQLRPLMDANDRLLVVNVTGDLAAWSGFNTACSDWLKSI